MQEEDKTQLYQHETVHAIANLATTIVIDRSTVAILTATNSTLTLALTDCQLQLVKALQNVAELSTALANLKKNPSARPPNNGNWYYCWTHVY